MLEDCIGIFNSMKRMGYLYLTSSPLFEWNGPLFREVMLYRNVSGILVIKSNSSSCKVIKEKLVIFKINFIRNCLLWNNVHLVSAILQELFLNQ